jgi:type IV pilus assembly protein PilY1
VVGCYDANRDFVAMNNSCVPGIEGSGDQLYTNASFNDLTRYIVGQNILCTPNPSIGPSPGFDGWSKDLLNYKERNLGQATLLGGLLSYSTYIPNVDVCNPEGSGYLYGIYYQTGTSWYEDVFARNPVLYDEPIDTGVFLGSGLSTTPNIHVGEEEGGKAFIQTSVGQIVEIPQPNLPMKDVTPGRIKWRDVE